MKKYLVLAIALLIFSAASLSAQEVATITYLDGWVDIKAGSGLVDEAFIGDSLAPGNSVITGKDSYAELAENTGSTYRISPETVFTVKEMDVKGTKQSVLSTTIGSVAFKFRRTASAEPLVATNSTVAGVRGTEFTVYAGADGSSLIAVTEGLVEVEAEGVSVELNPDEAVEVKPGEPPGPKFKLLGKRLDFSEWNDGRKEEFIKDPVSALKAVDKRLDYFNSQVEELHPIFLEWQQQAKDERDQYSVILKEKGEAAANEYREKVIKTTSNNAIALSLNVRYYALSALSMRRYIVGNMYAEMKTRNIKNLDNPAYREFEQLYKNLLEKFEKISIPRLNETDI